MKKFTLIAVMAIVKMLALPIIIRYGLVNYHNLYIGLIDILILFCGSSLIVWLMGFIFAEFYFWFFEKKGMVVSFYKMLYDKKFPNPWNYYINDGKTYLIDVANDKAIDGDIRTQAMRLWSEMEMMSSQGHFFAPNRFRYAFLVALYQYFGNFEDEYQIDPHAVQYEHKDKETSYILFLILP